MAQLGSENSLTDEVSPEAALGERIGGAFERFTAAHMDLVEEVADGLRRIHDVDPETQEVSTDLMTLALQIKELPEEVFAAAWLVAYEADTTPRY